MGVLRGGGRVDPSFCKGDDRAIIGGQISFSFPLQSAAPDLDALRERQSRSRRWQLNPFASLQDGAGVLPRWAGGSCGLLEGVAYYVYTGGCFPLDQFICDKGRWTLA